MDELLLLRLMLGRGSTCKVQSARVHATDKRIQRCTFLSFTERTYFDQKRKAQGIGPFDPTFEKRTLQDAQRKGAKKEVARAAAAQERRLPP